MSLSSPPGGSRLGRLGGAPVLTITWLPGRVAVWVWPPPVTVMLLPKMKLAVVLPLNDDQMVMPPRMPMVLDGVVTVMALVLLILPPTRRNTPLPAVSDSSPFLVTGS